MQFKTQGKEESKAVSRDPAYDPNVFIKKPKWYQCACGSFNHFRILTETDPMGDGCSQIVCDKCRRTTKVIQFSQPQVNEFMARNMGLILPDPSRPMLDIDVEIPRER